MSYNKGHQELKFLVTGGAGFIGSSLVCYIIANTRYHIVNVG